MPKRRFGVALLLPDDVSREVDALRRAVGDPALGRIPPHLTLVPPVNVREDRVADALAVLRRAAAASGPLRLTLGPPATFLPVNPVLYLSVGGDLEGLHRLRDAVFSEPLERRLTWPFHPHVTLADEAQPARIEAALAALDAYATEVVIDRIHLLEEGEGRTWRPVAEAPLAPAHVVGRGGVELEITTGEVLDPEARGVATREWRAYDDAAYGDDWAPRVPFAVAARHAGEVVGVAVGRTNGSYAYLDELIVSAAARGQGVGSRLLAAVEQLCRQRGVDRIDLTTPVGDEACAFYLARGWRELWRWPRARWERDWHVLRRDL